MADAEVWALALGPDYRVALELAEGRPVLRARGFHAPTRLRITLTFPCAADGGETERFKTRLVRSAVAHVGADE